MSRTPIVKLRTLAGCVGGTVIWRVLRHLWKPSRRTGFDSCHYTPHMSGLSAIHYGMLQKRDSQRTGDHTILVKVRRQSMHAIIILLIRLPDRRMFTESLESESPTAFSDLSERARPRFQDTGAIWRSGFRLGTSKACRRASIRGFKGTGPPAVSRSPRPSPLLHPRTENFRKGAGSRFFGVGRRSRARMGAG